MATVQVYHFDMLVDQHVIVLVGGDIHLVRPTEGSFYFDKHTQFVTGFQQCFIGWIVGSADIVHIASTE